MKAGSLVTIGVLFLSQIAVAQKPAPVSFEEIARTLRERHVETEREIQAALKKLDLLIQTASRDSGINRSQLTQ